MKIETHTKDGITYRELSQEEIEAEAQKGNSEAKQEIAKQKKATATTSAQRLDRIEEFLGI